MKFYHVLLAIIYFLLCGYFNKDCLALDNDVNDYDDDYYDDYIDDVNPNGEKNIDPTIHDKAYFVHPELQLYANEGDNVVIDCDVQNMNVLDNTVIMWYKNDMVIVSGKISVSHRINHLKNNSIRIQDVQMEDGGSYFCELLPEEIRMHTELKVANNLMIFCDDREITNKSLVFQQGEQHVCECKSFSKTNAVIKWFIDGEHAERVVTAVKDGKLYIESADEKHGGIYQCLVDDNSETPPYGMVLIDIFYVPQVSTHRHYVNSERGGEAQLYCDNSANPGAIVIWLKKGKAISDKAHKFSIINVLHKKRNRTVLNVIDVRTEDLGEYTCHAENSLGYSEIRVFLIYEPERPQLENMRFEGKKVTIQWLVRSFQPLTEAVLDYKLNGGYTWSTQSVIHARHKQKFDMWKIVHEMELTTGNWIVRLKTENSAGWSEFSDSHRFTLPESEFR